MYSTVCQRQHPQDDQTKGRKDKAETKRAQEPLIRGAKEKVYRTCFSQKIVLWGSIDKNAIHNDHVTLGINNLIPCQEAFLHSTYGPVLVTMTNLWT